MTRLRGLAACSLLVGSAAAAPPDAAADPPAPSWRGRVELKRQNTSRGTADESTRTTLRLELLGDGLLRQVRLDLPFPDEDTGFSGDPFSPRLGDIKFRLGLRPLRAGDFSFPSFIELTAPTADPPTLGAGKVQLSVGLRMLAPLLLPFEKPAAHETRFEVELQQVKAVAGDPARADIHYTKLELSVFDVWRRTWSLKLKLKPSADWAQDGRTGAVGEVEGGLNFAQRWRSTLMLGHRLWGPQGIGGTYDDRIELTVAREF
jgi:hypothetical protein